MFRFISWVKVLHGSGESLLPTSAAAESVSRLQLEHVFDAPRVVVENGVRVDPKHEVVVLGPVGAPSGARPPVGPCQPSEFYGELDEFGCC